ncbi:MAG TPA: alcohol dehydrogenase catalytic domain-containing protein [Actinomycetaceae bacterium]|nr:alcohol dehydrogenase catalytic domain-containing protein [Actinomycetaceae bacterium]
MSRVLVEGIGRVAVVEAPVPEPGPGQVRVRTSLAGICGSDTHAVAGHHPLLPPPYYPGHEATGTVTSVNEGVADIALGQRVILKPNVNCGECINCLAGRTNACQQLQWIGCDPSDRLPGAMADEFLAPAENLFVVPEDVTDEQAALVECLATPVHAARIAGDITGQRVAVLGAGTIGLFAVVAARHAGAGRIVVTDLDQGKRERALRNGAAVAFDPTREGFVAAVQEALGGPADVVFDCVANEASIAQAISILRRAGTLLIVGVPPRDLMVPMPLVQDWELRVQGCANYTNEDIETAIGMASGLVTEEIITGRFAISEAPEAFEVAKENSSGKVVVGPGSDHA